MSHDRRGPLSKAAPLFLRPLAIVFVATFATSTEVRAAEENTRPSSDESAILASIESYVAAYNRGDADATAEHWSDQGEWISPSGERLEGKKAIAEGLREMFAQARGTTIEVLAPKVRLLTADAAVEHGTVVVRATDEAPETSSYVALHVKQGGRWKLDSVTETARPRETAAASPLDELDWLVGDWVDTTAESEVTANITWTKNRSFLNYSFHVAAPGADDLEGTQIVGFDPATGSIRSWMFDSDGGWGEGSWSKNGTGWVVKLAQILPDGRRATCTNVYSPGPGDTIVWKSIGRSVDGEYLPNIDAVKLVRKKEKELTKSSTGDGEPSEVGKKQLSGVPRE